ncbi:MAG: putative integral membrane protein conserved region-domain-containing protein, partial [Piptocephalis tieghemiana]
FAVLKYDTLFLYDSEAQLECRGVIVISMYHISPYPPNSPEAEVYGRSHCLRLHPPIDGDDYYVWASTPVDLESWHFALLDAASASGTADLPDEESPLRFDPRDMLELMAHLSIESPSLPGSALLDRQGPRWVNALIGRAWLAHYHTQHLHDYVMHRLARKLARAKTPGLVDWLRVRDLDVGRSAPRLTSNPRLVDLTESGDLTLALDLAYEGGMRVEVESRLAMPMAMPGTGGRVLGMTVVLAVKVHRLSGRLHLRMGPPPSNRIWLGFDGDPTLEMQIEPVVADRKVGWSRAISVIDRKLRDMLKEAMVLPHMEDFVIGPTRLGGSGGIFGR